jgi:hypothetical protein
VLQQDVVGRSASHEVVFRADAAFAKPEICEESEARGVKYAIRIPANDSLERNIAELLTRPVGRPSHKPVVRYRSFLYQAASWNKARRVVAKVEFHAGELFPRVGFIVTNLETKAERWCGSTTGGEQRSSGSKPVLWLLLAESHLTRRLFGSMVRRITALAVPTGLSLAAGTRRTWIR